MSKVVFFTLPHFGHVNPNLGLISELVARGESIVCYSGEQYRGVIESTGAVFRAFSINCEGVFMRHSSLVRELFTTDTVEEKIRLLLSFSELNLKFNRAVHLKYFDEVMEEKPDYILYDSYAFWGKTIAQRLGIPAVCCESALVVPSSLMKTDIDYILKYVLEFTDEEIEGVSRDEISRQINWQFRRIDKKYNIKGFNVFDYYASDQLNIVYITKELQPFSEHVDERYRYVGFEVFKAGNQDASPLTKKRNRPLIYISRGTMLYERDFMQFYEICTEAFGGSDMQVLLTTGGNIDEGRFAKAPENITVKGFVPQLEVLSKADLFITHGGLSGVREALYYNVPMILCPHSAHHLQVSRQIESLGAGIFLKHNEINADRLKDAVNRVLSDANYKNNAARLGRSLRAAGGAVKAAEEIFKMKDNGWETKGASCI
ncbi:macrolide family glycosyltransferase [Thermoactinomyces sp. CICC 10522]|uniref:macrolide family glycosyltransferase n=1 Tax=Thermoactinomyces sp. CICC 10522 TaxID=2767427 RepID=UPI0018DB6814|nr:macrolide family glycosyltransferase [Thermoactinomyces sp. CICC 10522]MBH8605862.1 hypothetical protein [Thermoactinomyces sp. CICC 10522]